MERKEGETGYQSLHHPELEAINDNYRSGALPLDKARMQVDLLKTRLEKAREKPVSWLPENFQVAEQYIRERVVPKRSNRRPKAATDRILWGIKQLGSTSLIGSSEAQLIAALAHLEPSQERRAVSVINSLLKFKHIPTTLHPPPVDIGDPLYLSLEEFEKVWPTLPKLEWQLACKAAYATGARYGELFDFYERNLRQDGTHIYISHQLDRELKRVVTKNKMKGEAFIIPKYRLDVMKWCGVAEEEKVSMRKLWVPGEQWKWACLKVLRQAFTFHNLRHSYANHMLTQGASLEDLKIWMRDRMSTIETYYANWRLTSSQMKSNIDRFG